jgi:hypothetical protein
VRDLPLKISVFQRFVKEHCAVARSYFRSNAGIEIKSGLGT